MNQKVKVRSTNCFLSKVKIYHFHFPITTYPQCNGSCRTTAQNDFKQSSQPTEPHSSNQIPCEKSDGVLELVDHCGGAKCQNSRRNFQGIPCAGSLTNKQCNHCNQTISSKLFCLLKHLQLQMVSFWRIFSKLILNYSRCPSSSKNDEHGFSRYVFFW